MSAAVTPAMTPNGNNNSNAARNHKKVESVVAKVKGRDHELSDDELKDPALKCFIDAKLKEWDKDKSGRFEIDEVQMAMDDMRTVLDQLASLKWTLIITSIALSLLLCLVLGAGAVAIALVKETKIGSNGQLTKSDDGSVIVTSEVQGVDDIDGCLNFDENDDWGLTDAQIRDLDAISFSDGNGTFYHEKIAQLIRFDSGPTGGTDQIEILTEAGHQLRFFEANEFGLEVKWADQQGMQWTLLMMPLMRRLSASVDSSDSYRRLAELGDDEEDDTPELRDAPPSAPERLLSKGGYVGGVYVHSHGGSGRNGRCDPSYIEGQHDRKYYCDSAQHFAGLSSVLLAVPIVSSLVFLA